MAKRVALYTSSFPPKTGGIASAHFNLFHQLSRHHDVKAFVFRDTDRSTYPNLVRGKVLPGQKALFKCILRKLLKQSLFSRELKHCDRIAETAASIMSMNRELMRFSPDLIICPDHYAPALLIRKPRGSRLIWMAHNNYLRFTKQPLVPPPNIQDLLLAHRLENRALRKADALVSPSEYMLNVFRESFEHDLPMRVARNFVDRERISAVEPSNLRQILGIESKTPLIYIPSGGLEMKGGRYIYEIIRRISKVGSLGVYISGAMPNYLKNELNSIEKVRCFLPGHVDYEVNLGHVKACDLTISPTLIENLSIALVESILLGVPVVTFDTGGNSEVIADGKTGFVADHADVDGLIRFARRLLEDHRQLDLLKTSCAMHAVRIVDTDQILNVYNTLFQELLCDGTSAVERTSSVGQL